MKTLTQVDLCRDCQGTGYERAHGDQAFECSTCLGSGMEADSRIQAEIEAGMVPDETLWPDQEEIQKAKRSPVMRKKLIKKLKEVC